MTPPDPAGSPPQLNRRTFLAAALAAGGGGLLAAMGGGGAGAATISAATKVKAAGSDLGAIEHVIFFMQENRSFDHYYGAYKGVRGFDDHPHDSLGAFAQAWPGGTSSHLLPFHLRIRLGYGRMHVDLNGMRAPNLSGWRRDHAGDLTSTLHMRHKDASTPLLPSTSKDLPADAKAEGCTPLDLVEASGDKPPYPVPKHQIMARQEAGGRDGSDGLARRLSGGGGGAPAPQLRPAPSRRRWS